MKEVVERLALITGACASFGATFALALMDRSSAATVMAGLTVAFLALYFLPLVDSIEAFGLKAKLREKVVEADKLVDGLRSTAVVASSIMYAQLGWLGRMGAPSWTEKRQWYQDLESNLRALEVDAKAVRDLQRPFLDFVSFDLYALFESVVGERLRYHGRKLAGEIGELQAKQEKDEAAIIALTEKKREVESAIPGLPDAHLSPDLANLSKLVERRLDATPLPDDDKAKLRAYAAKYVQLSDKVQLQSAITDDALNVLEAHVKDYQLWKADYKALFGD